MATQAKAQQGDEMRDLDQTQLSDLSRGCRLSCFYRGFVLGRPQGGHAINIECTDVTCRGHFNVAFRSGEALLGQHIGNGRAGTRLAVGAEAMSIELTSVHACDLAFMKAMEVWLRSLKCPDLDERQRVAGAIAAYQSALDGMAIVAGSHQSETDGGPDG
jgi:hypothetical protein